MDFDGGYSHRTDGVAEGDAGVGVGGGINDDSVEIVLGLLNPINQFAFRIGLAEVHRRAERVGPAADARLDVGESRLAVNFGFAVS